MNESQMTRAVNWLLFLASAFLFYGLAYVVTDEHGIKPKEKAIQKVENISVPEYHEPKPVIYNPFAECLKQIKVPIYEKCVAIHTEYIGEYFVTAYASAELGGSTMTASGAQCEYHEEWNIPTTCAIDPRIHSFGEYLMIEGKIYVCTDTGGNVKGHWVDCYVPDMSSVWGWNTGYKSVYSVTFEEKQIQVGERTLYESFRNYLFSWCVGGRSYFWNDCRTVH